MDNEEDNEEYKVILKTSNVISMTRAMMIMMMMIMKMVKTIVMTVTTKIVTDPMLWSRLAGAHRGHRQNISLPCKLQIKILTTWQTLTSDHYFI